jgi:phosphate transport system permease protein
MQEASDAPDPRRFEVSRATLWFDRLMGWLIRLGGIAVILAVFGILYFVAKEVVPLFRGAMVHEAGSAKLPLGAKILGVDEWGTTPFSYHRGSSVRFIDIATGNQQELELTGFEDAEVTACSFDPVRSRVAVGTADGRIGSFIVRYERTQDASGNMQVTPRIESEPWFQLREGSGPVTALSYGDSGTGRLIAAQRGVGASSTVSILRLAMKRGLVGSGKLSLLGESDVTGQLGSEVIILRASQNGLAALIACADGKVRYFLADAGGVTLRQTFEPFAGDVPRSMDFLFGGVSAILTGPDGTQEQWSLFRSSEDAERLFGKTKSFPALGQAVPVFAASQRNRTFLTTDDCGVSLRHSTSGDTRWEGPVGIDPALAVMDAKGEHFLVADAQGELRRYRIHDPHPEAGWRAFFAKVWYEGGSGPVWQWQSTGGSDDFEPKFSMMPLIFGSLKGTAYALFFSVPVALLAAVFSAAFLPLEFKRIIKPLMEIMASLPSVVLGFLAGLWLAPILETRVPSVLAIIVLLPITALAAGFLWCRLPTRWRHRFAPGSEWWMAIPVMAVAGWVGWIAGPAIEAWCFTCTDPATGKTIADFRLWWPQATGTAFEQRNSLVLGFMMGFAVIPVIFTIAEDALSNVPKPLTAAAAALGASRWHVVRTILLPVASAGIFSALMIGFGRAVGETMIMVMATGNTPITEWNIFNGMRTLSANIAVELPEAPVGSTHYRALFLGAVVLFAMTFIMNTVAEVLRQRLRERNRIV